jgi:putative MFS transporter
MAESDGKIRRPWWTYIIPYAGKVPDLSNKQWSLLGLLAAAEIFDQYDMALMGLALAQIQEGLAIPETQIAAVTGVARLGVLLSFAMMIMADRLGRRRLLLITILGFTVSTFATAFARDATDFMILQFAARAFVYAEVMLASVVIAEELGARDRGWGLGMLGALGSLGHGFAAIAFAFVDDLPFGWRALYTLGVIPLLLLAWFRRSLKETRRFEEHKAQGMETGGLEALRPAINLLRMYPRRMAFLALALVPYEFVAVTAFTLLPKTLQEVHGYTPGNVTILFLVGGVIGILGNIFAGVLSDRFGRKPVMCTAMVFYGLGVVGFYNSTGWVVPAFWIVVVFSTLAVGVLFKALGAELFPTSYRSTASGMRMTVGTLGGVLGLSIEGSLYTMAGSHSAAITWMAPALLISPIAVALLLPETASRELEDIAPELAPDES